MITYLANPSTADIRAAMLRYELGCILTPRQHNLLPVGSLWCADNGCGPGKDGRLVDGYPGDEAYLGILQGWAAAEDADPCDPDTSGCLFAAAPDVVGDARATLKRSERMLDWIRYAGYPAAFVAQNGLEDLDVPWDSFDVLFIGGSKECQPCGYVCPVADRERDRCPYCLRVLAEWKLGPAARWLVAEAKRRGKRVHMGRVNSRKRLLAAHDMGCDTADGTKLTRAPDRYLPVVLSWQRDANAPRPDGLWELAS